MNIKGDRFYLVRAEARFESHGSRPFAREGRCHVVWTLRHWVRARDCGTDLRCPLNACPCTLDCRGCDRTVGPRDSDGSQSNSPKGSVELAVIFPCLSRSHCDDSSIRKPCLLRGI